MSHDSLSAAMFWAGALMAFTPVVAAGIVLAVWWRTREHGEKTGDGE